VELALPKSRLGSYFPTWLLERRRPAEQALISVVATAYLLGVSTRRVEKVAQSLGWLAFLRSLTARGLSGFQLVVSDAHTGLGTRSERSGPAPAGRVVALTKPATC
jgi:transposase-like protein